MQNGSTGIKICVDILDVDISPPNMSNQTEKQIECLLLPLVNELQLLEHSWVLRTQKNKIHKGSWQKIKVGL